MRTVITIADTYSIIIKTGARNQQFIETTIVAINEPKGIFLVINGAKRTPFITINNNNLYWGPNFFMRKARCDRRTVRRKLNY